MTRSRWLIPAGFFLLLSGGGLAVSSSLRRAADPFALVVLRADTAPDRRPGDGAARAASSASTDSFAQTTVAPILRSLRFAILRAQSPPR